MIRGASNPAMCSQWRPEDEDVFAHPIADLPWLIGCRCCIRHRSAGHRFVQSSCCRCLDKEITCKTDGTAIRVDDEDHSLLSRFPLYRGGVGGHPMTFIYGKKDTSQTVHMHQLIMGGMVGADHIDRDVLNNQKSDKTRDSVPAFAPPVNRVTQVIRLVGSSCR
jgi:hypothetical protein